MTPPDPITRKRYVQVSRLFAHRQDDGSWNVYRTESKQAHCGPCVAVVASVGPETVVRILQSMRGSHFLNGGLDG